MGAILSANNDDSHTNQTLYVSLSNNETTTTVSRLDDDQKLTDGTNSVIDSGNSGINGTRIGKDFKFNFLGKTIYPLEWITFSNLSSALDSLSSLGMILGCVLPYVPQYTTIRKNKSCGGFSTYVCLTLLVANILRIAFWFGHPFETPLLIQSILMILAQLLLLELCVRVKRHNTKKTFFSLNPRYFWQWTDFPSYLEFLILISAIIGVVTYIFRKSNPYIEVLGYCSLVTESMLGLPQVIKNFRNKSVEGMSLSMVLMWLAGDTYKMAYFVKNESPYQFWVCALLQISIDLLILFQVFLYRRVITLKANPRVPKEMMAL